MRRKQITVALTAAMMFVGLTASAHGQGAKGPKPLSLYQRLGGYDGLAAIFDDVAPRMAADPELARFFTGHSTDSDLRQRQRLLELLCQETGGPCVYTGLPLKKAHGGLGISESQWKTFQKHLTATLDHLKIGAKEKGELLAIVGGYKADIVEKQ
ncbi:MAG TPA: group 1 truncated hemoglobin [Blastocatellia bacterium]|nr:group 1 truncated hemoglobin [Blastocatellia bacterium]